MLEKLKTKHIYFIQKTSESYYYYITSSYFRGQTVEDTSSGVPVCLQSRLSLFINYIDMADARSESVQTLEMDSGGYSALFGIY